MAKHLTTAEQVLDEFGGYLGMAKLLGTYRQRTHNWLMAGHFPGNTYVLINEALRQRGKTASPELWPTMKHQRLKSLKAS